MVTPTPTTVQVKIQLRGDTAANWASVNPVLLTNELGLETDTKKLKVGDGTTAWNTLAYFPSIVTGGTVLGNLEIGSTGTLTFEGSTADGFETTLAVTDPTEDRTITLPDQSGTVVVTGNASIVDADIAANAEIAVSKLADGAARQLLQTDADGTGVEWTDNVDVPGTLDVTSNATFDADVTIQGDLTVNGTTTTVNTETLTVKDKNIELAVVDTPTDTTANGGGITLKGATDKTLNWVETGASWTSSENVDLATGKSYKIGTTDVLSANTLGSGVINSSLTSVGTIGTGIWQGTAVSSDYGGTGQASYANGELLIGKTDGTLAKATLTAGSNVTIVNADGSITISATDTNTTYTAGTGLSLTDTTFSIDSSVVTTSDTGSVTSTMIADGTIVNNDVSSSAAIAGSKISPNFGSQTVTTTGVFSAAVGAAASPSITFTGDTNTGIYSPGADQVAISTGGNERLRITSDGKLGVGTSNPDDYLTVAASDTSGSLSDSNAAITLVNTNSDAFGRTSNLNFNQGNSTTAQRLASISSVYTNYTTSVGGALAFSTNNGSGTVGERLRITSDGKLGLGTSAPSEILDVRSPVTSGTYQARIALQNTDQRTIIGSYWRSGVGQYSIIQAINAAENLSQMLLLNPSGGNVGIGTSAPTVPLEVAGQIRALDGTVDLRLNPLAAGNAGIVGTYSNHALVLNTNSTEKARIDSSGRVGIGTPAPLYKLDVAGSCRVGAADTSNANLEIGEGATGNRYAYIDLIGDTTYTDYGFRIIRQNTGANAVTQLAHRGTGQLEFNAVESAPIVFAHNTAERVRIGSSGEVFVGGISSSTGRTLTAKTIGLWNNGSNSEIGWFGNSPNAALKFNAWWDAGVDRLHITDADYSNGVYLAQNSNSWAAFSDARLKENIAPFDGSIEIVKQLKPCSYNWKSNQARDIGFIAQEVKAVFPEAVDGEESDFYIDEETGRFYGAMGLKTDKLIPLLTAALQEALAKIETLEAKVAALEAS